MGGYPEKHIEAPNLKTDIKHLKEKVDAGRRLHRHPDVLRQRRFLHATCEQCREAGITVPIIPGIKLIDGVRQLTTLPKHFHVTMPDELVDEIMESPNTSRRSAAAGASSQVEELMNAGCAASTST